LITNDLGGNHDGKHNSYEDRGDEGYYLLLRVFLLFIVWKMIAGGLLEVN
jgi:hypothetical protein